VRLYRRRASNWYCTPEVILVGRPCAALLPSEEKITIPNGTHWEGIGFRPCSPKMVCVNDISSNNNLLIKLIYSLLLLQVIIISRRQNYIKHQIYRLKPTTSSSISLLPTKSNALHNIGNLSNDYSQTKARK
jgi:hypothetical protein